MFAVFFVEKQSAYLEFIPPNIMSNIYNFHLLSLMLLLVFHFFKCNMRFEVDVENVARVLLWPIRALGALSSSKSTTNLASKLSKLLGGRIDI